MLKLKNTTIRISDITTASDNDLLKLRHQQYGGERTLLWKKVNVIFKTIGHFAVLLDAITTVLCLLYQTVSIYAWSHKKTKQSNLKRAIEREFKVRLFQPLTIK